MQRFPIRDAVLVADDELSAYQVRNALPFEVVTLEQLDAKAQRPLLVFTESETAGVDRVRDLIATGADPSLVRFVAYGPDLPLPEVLRPERREWLRSLFVAPAHHWWNTGRFLVDWPNEGDLQTYPIDIEGLGDHARLAPGSIVAVVGGYGSGKSSFAQRIVQGLALQHDLPGGVCAWEDRRNDFRERTWRYALGPDHLDVSDKSRAIELERKLWWWEPTRIDERTVDLYFDWVERTTREFGIRVHLLDPWNELDHDYSGSNETQYTRKVMMHVQRLTRELGIIFILVCHLPKAGYDDQGRIKPFRVVHAAGSAEFGNKAAHGFCVARSSRLHAALDLDNEDLDDDKKARAFQIRADFGPPLATEHMIVAVDKVKIEPEMGKRGVFAFFFDRSCNQLRLDHAATEVVRDIWRVF